MNHIHRVTRILLSALVTAVMATSALATTPPNAWGTSVNGAPPVDSR